MQDRSELPRQLCRRSADSSHIFGLLDVAKSAREGRECALRFVVVGAPERHLRGSAGSTHQGILAGVAAARDNPKVTERVLTEREAFRAARKFLEQFNERENCEPIMLLIAWMAEGTWETNSLETADPAQWFDWVQTVDRVIAERDQCIGQ